MPPPLFALAIVHAGAAGPSSLIRASLWSAMSAP
jgi:hypothetical protein